jgi:vacuolar-type H+-ATPase subunit C/Vma6
MSWKYITPEQAIQWSSTRNQSDNKIGSYLSDEEARDLANRIDISQMRSTCAGSSLVNYLPGTSRAFTQGDEFRQSCFDMIVSGMLQL